MLPQTQKQTQAKKAHHRSLRATAVDICAGRKCFEHTQLYKNSKCTTTWLKPMEKGTDSNWKHA